MHEVLWSLFQFDSHILRVHQLNSTGVWTILLDYTLWSNFDAKVRRKHQAAKVGAALKYSNEYIDYNANPLNLLIVPYTIHQWINSRHYSNRVTPNVLCYCCETIIWYGVPSQNPLLAPFFRTHSLSFFRSLYFLITSNCTCDSQAQAQSTTTLFCVPPTKHSLSLSPQQQQHTKWFNSMLRFT